MCIGEAPGFEEDRGGRPFIGRSGKEFNLNYLKIAGLSRDDIYITNSVKCRPDLNRKPSEREVKECASWWIPDEVNEVMPEVVILMGATACSMVDGLDLEVEHGIARRVELGEGKWGLEGYSGWVIPMYHPAGGMHNTSLMTPLLEDWERVGTWLREEHHRQPKERETDYRLVSSVKEVRAYFERHHRGFIYDFCAVDTETHAGVPWSIQLSVRPGTAIMARIDDSRESHEVLKAIGFEIEHEIAFTGTEIVFHNADADIELFKSACGITVPFSWRDTMQEAYQFQNLPQGLKALSYRILGRKRRSWYEVCAPGSKSALMGWMTDGLSYAETYMDQVIERVHKKTGKRLEPKIVRSEAGKVLDRISRYLVQNETYDPWERLDGKRGEEWMEELVSVLGEVPRLGIGNVELSEAVEYGCADADDTLRLAKEFEWRRLREQTAFWNVNEEDYDG